MRLGYVTPHGTDRASGLTEPVVEQYRPRRGTDPRGCLHEFLSLIKRRAEGCSALSILRGLAGRLGAQRAHPRPRVKCDHYDRSRRREAARAPIGCGDGGIANMITIQAIAISVPSTNAARTFGNALPLSQAGSPRRPARRGRTAVGRVTEAASRPCRTFAGGRDRPS
jgi:hypothetical protein